MVLSKYAKVSLIFEKQNVRFQRSKVKGLRQNMQRTWSDGMKKRKRKGKDIIYSRLSMLQVRFF